MSFRPPRYALKFLRWFCREDYLDEVEGDLAELFERNLSISPSRANADYTFQVIRHLRPEFMKSIRPENPVNMLTLLRHNILLAFRNSRKYPGSFLINLLGLSTGLACTLIIYLWVRDEVGMDQFQSPQLFQVMENRVQASGIWTAYSSPGLMAEAMAQDFPEVSHSVTIRPDQGGVTLSYKDKDIQARGSYVSNDYFNVFSAFPLLKGDIKSLLIDRKSIVISESFAKNFFGGVDQAMTSEIERQHEGRYHVTGVFKDLPANSSEQFDYLLSFNEINDQEWLHTWGSTGCFTYVTLKPGTDVTAFNAKVADYVVKKTENKITYRTVFVSRFIDRYLHSGYENGVRTGGRIEYVRLFSIIAGVILVIACINFMNLSTAKASRRLKEIGVKKAVGAGRRSLISQYLSESLLMTAFSLVVGLLLVILLLPKFNELAGKHLTLVSDPEVAFAVLFILAFTGLAAGSYPALYLSGFKPSAILKGNALSGFSGKSRLLGEGWARKGLVVFQFATSVVMIVSVLVVYKQIQYVQTRDIGYNRDNVIAFQRQGGLWDQGHFRTFLEEVHKLPGVIGASGIGHSMIGHNSGTWGVVWPGKDPENHTEFENISVDYGAIETLDMKIVAGRAFQESFGADTTKVIFNEAGIKFMGMTDPIGKTVKIWDKDMEIIGIVKDFNFQSLHEVIKPVFFRLATDNSYQVMAKIAHGKEPETIASLKKIFERDAPGFTFNYSFLDENYQKQYAGEERVATLSRYFAGLAILISCLGLFGLASFTTERRIKEIGIRKVLGSSSFGIVFLLTTEFTRMVVVAIIVALPISYFLTKDWLTKFAFRIDLSVWYFAGAGLTVLLVAWITVGLQTIKAARVNPAACLKTE